MKFIQDMKIKNKLILSGVALLMPLILVTHLLIKEKNLVINFAQKEVYGVEYLVSLEKFLEHLPQHRVFVDTYLRGNRTFKDKISRKASEMDDAMVQVDAMNQKYGERLAASEKWNAVKQEWNRFKGESLNLSAKESFDRHTKIIEDVITLTTHVGNTSNLILDPDIDSYYLMDTIVLKIPAIIDEVGQEYVLGTGIATRNTITADEKIELLLRDGKFKVLLQGLSTGIAAAVTENGSLRPIQTTANQAQETLDQFLQTLENKIQSTEGLNLNASEYLAAGLSANSMFFELHSKSAQALTELLNLRINNTKTARNNALLLVLICITAGLLVGGYTLYTINKPLIEMTTAVNHVATGDLSPIIRIQGKDEIGLLGTGFMKMLDALKAADIQKAKMQRISAMIENSSTNFLFADNDLRLTYMNPASEQTLQKIAQLLPCPVDQMVGKLIDDLHKNSGRIKNLLSNPKNLPHTEEFKLGDEIIQSTVTAIFDHNRNRIGTMANWKIVTEKARMKSSLKETTISLASASEELATASREMRANAEETTQQAQNVASISHQTDQNVQSVAAAAEEMSVTVREISKNVHNANQITEQAVAMAESMNATITKLDASNSEIGNVVKVISMIAGQTNLLALNATIEAARAGDAGKGFAVVANEVKELAKGTSKATDEIRQQIMAIQANTKGAIESIEKITEIIKENNAITTTIASAVEQQSMTTNEISVSMAEAARETKEVVEELEHIISTSQSTASSAGSIGEASEELSRTANKLSAMTEI